MKFLRRVLWRLARWALLAAAAFYALCAFALLALRWIDPPATAVQAERRISALVHRRPYQKRCEFVPLGRMAPDLPRAVVAAEDTRFFQHHGVDWKEVSKAVEDHEEGEPLRGASTITQQLARNLFLSTSRSAIRKAAEFPLAYLVEAILPKRRILELYLNVIEWGPGVYGAEAAARFHYRTSAARLSRDQAARLAAILPSPLRRKPARMDNYSAAIEARMRQMGW